MNGVCGARWWLLSICVCVCVCVCVMEASLQSGGPLRSGSRDRWNSLVTATLLLFLPSSMVSMTSSGLHTKRSVQPCTHTRSQGWVVLAAPYACTGHTLISRGHPSIVSQTVTRLRPGRKQRFSCIQGFVTNKPNQEAADVVLYI